MSSITTTSPLGMVLHKLRDRVASHPDFTSSSEANGMIVAEDVIPPGPHERVWQVSFVGEARMPHARSGVPIIEGTVRVSIFKRCNLDRAGELDTAIIDEDRGIMTDATSIEDHCVHSFLEGVLLTPLVIVSMGGPTTIKNPDGSGWLKCWRDFRFSVLSDAPQIAQNANGSGEDRGAIV